MAKKRNNHLTDQLRQVIDDSGLTRYRISKETGVSESALAQFYNGHRGLSIEALTQVTLLRSIFDFFGVEKRRKSNVDGSEIAAGRCSEDLVS